MLFVSRRLIELIRFSGLPLWDPYLHGGQPFLGNPSNLAMYPSALLYFLLPPITAFNLEIVLHFLLCAFFTYWLARVLGLSPAAAFLSAMAVTLCGFTLSLANLLNRLLAMPHTVASLLFLQLFFLQRRALWFVLAAVSGALIVLAGSVEFLILTTPVTLGWALAYPFPDKSLKPRGRVLIWASLALAAMGLAAVQICPAVSVIRQSTRGSGLNLEAISRWSLNPRRLPELFVPEYSGPTHTLAPTDYWGRGIEDFGFPFILSIYFGVPLLLLAFREAIARTDDRLPKRLRRLLSWTAVTGLLLSLGRFSGLLRGLSPDSSFLTLFRYPVKALGIAVLPIALLAGASADRLRVARRDRASLRSLRGSWDRWIALVYAAFAGIAAILALSRLRAIGLVEQFLFLNPLSAEQSGLFAVRLLQSSLAAGICWGLLSENGRVGAPRWRVWALAALVALDLAWGGSAVNVYTSREIFAKAPPSAALVRRSVGAGKLFRDRNPSGFEIEAPSNDNQWRFRWRESTLDGYLASAYGIPVVFHDDYDVLGQRRLVRLTSLIEQVPWDQRLPLLSAGGVTAILAPGHLPPRRGLELVAEIPNRSNVRFFLYKNLDAAPAAGFVSTWATVETETNALRAIASRGFDSRHDVVLEGPSAPPHAGCGSAPVREIQREPRIWKGVVDAPCDGYVVFTDPFYAGWRGSVDGREANIQRANLAFSAIPVRRGRHEILKTFQPASVPFGIGLSIASAMATVAVAVGLCRWGRSERADHFEQPAYQRPPGA